MAFIEAVAKATGNKQRIPEHWLSHPTIGAQFKLPPSAAKSEAKAEKSEPKKSDS